MTKVNNQSIDNWNQLNNAERMRVVLRQQYQNKVLNQIANVLKQQKFITIDTNSEYRHALFEVSNHTVWVAYDSSFDLDGINQWIAGLPKMVDINLGSWHQPSALELSDFAQNKQNPWRRGSNNRLFGEYRWCCSEGSKDLDYSVGSDGVSSNRSGYWIQKTRQLADVKSLLLHAQQHNLILRDIKGNILFNLKEELLDGTLPDLYWDIDYNRCRLPELNEYRFTDIHQGMWEWVGLPENDLTGLRARDPLRDVRHGNIGIDFGTSSTVVAYEDENGSARLLRVGVRDFYEAARPEHYENPTVLDFIDFNSFQKEWTQLAHQPLVQWDNVCCSHEALANLRGQSAEVDPKVVGRILSKIKQWALREADDYRVRITDGYGVEHELAPLTLRNPVKGASLTVSENDVFDPIELYAWFLGLNINWRGRGIFLKYYMTFPVAYPSEVKGKILASFRRGLLRSLPESLTHHAEQMEKFSVEERASEPAAYVAAAMEAHEIEPTEEGIAYAVFDFGGGTTDFDFGFYRWANEEEEAQGIERVFEHFEAAGDKFLGGENLLENLAYIVFKHNVDYCRQHHISFTKPLDAKDFSGSEMLLEKTQAAYANTLILMSYLRPFWENGSINDNDIASVNLMNRHGEKISCELSLPLADLQGYLDERIQQGILDFFIAMKKAFGDEMPKEINILLAGNSSRSRLVTDAFGCFDEENADDKAFARYDLTVDKLEAVFGDSAPEWVAYEPLDADETDESQPTAKTGVALGILRLCPGSTTKVINRTAQRSCGEAPFAHYVGNSRRNKFNVGIQRNAEYGVGHQIGIAIEGVLNLYHTQSNFACSGEMPIGYNELYYKRLDFSGSQHNIVFARAIAPDVIEVGVAADLASAQNGQLDSLQEVIL